MDFQDMNLQASLHLEEIAAWMDFQVKCYFVQITIAFYSSKIGICYHGRASRLMLFLLIGVYTRVGNFVWWILWKMQGSSNRDTVICRGTLGKWINEIKVQQAIQLSFGNITCMRADWNYIRECIQNNLQILFSYKMWFIKLQKCISKLIK